MPRPREKAAPASDSGSAAVRTIILPPALVLLAILALAPVPVSAGGAGWHAGGGHWSLPAGARFSWSSRGGGFLARGFGGHLTSREIFVGVQPRHDSWRGRTKLDP